MDKAYYVYILTNVRNSVLYVGVTNDLERRLYEHREGYSEKSFSNRYHTHKLVYYETCSDVASSIEREKQIKGYSRAKKIELIKKVNPDWSDLSKEWE